MHNKPFQVQYTVYRTCTILGRFDGLNVYVFVCVCVAGGLHMVFPSMGQGNNASPPSSPSNTPVSSRYVCVSFVCFGSLYNVRVE